MNQGKPQKENTVFQIQVLEITSDKGSASLGICFTAQCVDSNAVVCCTIGKSTAVEAQLAYEHIVRAHQATGGVTRTVQVRVVKQWGDGSLAVDLVTAAGGNEGSVATNPPVAKRRRYYK